jgi:MFS family permease
VLKVLANRTYCRLLTAQVIALLGTGLLTVALGLLAFQLAGDRAGTVLGTALAIKVVASVTVAPVVGTFAAQLPRRATLVTMKLVRAAIALLLPFVTEIWQIYVLIFLLQSVSAAFTPTFQATIPDVLTDETDYTMGLSLSRLAYDLETLVSPLLAAALLTLINFQWLFSGTVVGFLVSAALVLSITLPISLAAVRSGGIYEKTLRGMRIYLATQRLRGLLALNVAAAAGGAMVIVNSVAIVKGRLGCGDGYVALAFASFCAGSMLAALNVPRLLDHVGDRPVMLGAAGAMALIVGVLALGTALLPGSAWVVVVIGWAALGIAYSAVLTPGGRLLRRSAHVPDRPAVFAAQFALSHACWLVTYPLAGWLGENLQLRPPALATSRQSHWWRSASRRLCGPFATPVSYHIAVTTWPPTTPTAWRTPVRRQTSLRTSSSSTTFMCAGLPGREEGGNALPVNGSIDLYLLDTRRHLSDFGILIFDDLLRHGLRHYVLAELDLHVGHVDRALMMRDHAAVEGEIGVLDVLRHHHGHVHFHRGLHRGLLRLGHWCLLHAGHAHSAQHLRHVHAARHLGHLHVLQGGLASLRQDGKVRHHALHAAVLGDGRCGEKTESSDRDNKCIAHDNLR